MATAESGLVVAVTGPTGTFGAGLLPLLEADPRIARTVGIARRPFDPAAAGWTSMAYRQGDVRDPAALREAFAGVDVVVHLAFLITGTASREEIRAINVEGTLNAFRAAADAGARRFVYASSVAAYGFHADNPVGMTEDWPVRPAAHLFYAQEKAELEHLLAVEANAHREIDLYLLRPPVVLGPHAVGAKQMLPRALGPLTALAPAGRRAAALLRRAPLHPPVPVPPVRLQFVHEDDVGQALLLCAVGAGPPGAYNISGAGSVSVAEIAREVGLFPVPLPGAPVRLAARAFASLPFLPPAAEWAEALSHPAIMDTSRAERLLGWTPRYSSLEALRDTLP
ncbi:MAG TPA: NAD-dependent epimerase/dehydratase family protein [Mycobacteriales bacterium]